MGKINWSQSSTKRGLIWVIVGVIGVYYTWGTQDVNQLLSIGATVAGGLGIIEDDNK